MAAPLTFVIALWNNDKMPLCEIGSYIAVLMQGLFAAMAVKKNTRDSKPADDDGESP